jgi:CRISPR-associated protein Cas2
MVAIQKMDAFWDNMINAFEDTSENVKNTLRIVAYDIASPQRLRLVARACSDYGVRVEKSVFECDLCESDFSVLWERLLGIIDEQEDALVSYKICKTCVKSILEAGIVKRPKARFTYIY